VINDDADDGLRAKAIIDMVAAVADLGAGWSLQ
jgi:hypothetical protein